MTNEFLQYFNKKAFQQSLLSWYEANKRDLPWRKTKDPYKIWVSEVMLQQTQVATVIPYFERFMKDYPTVYDLAAADEQAVLKMWEGLGYYSRARNLHEAAKQVVADFDGKVPNNVKEISQLKGVGPYTRGAILSIAYDMPEPAVDGNVMRVMSRVLDIEDNISEAKTKKLFEAIMREVVSEEDPSSFNQGLMEIGALICSPKKPACLHCPLREYCKAFETGLVDQLPVKGKQKKQKVIDYYAVILKNEDGQVAIVQRPSKGLLANMWQFPMIPKENVRVNDWLENDYHVPMQLSEELGHVKHVFSHLIWNLHIYEANVTWTEENKKSFTFVNIADLDAYPFSVSHQKIKALL